MSQIVHRCKEDSSLFSIRNVGSSVVLSDVRKSVTDVAFKQSSVSRDSDISVSVVYVN